MIMLAVKADDEHRPSVALTTGLVGSKHGRVSALGRGVSDALAETAVAEFVSAAKEFDGVVGVVRSDHRLHGAKVLVAKGQ
jgi:aspartokinase